MLGYPSVLYSSSKTTNELQQSVDTFPTWGRALLATAAAAALGSAPTPHAILTLGSARNCLGNTERL